MRPLIKRHYEEIKSGQHDHAFKNNMTRRPIASVAKTYACGLRCAKSQFGFLTTVPGITGTKAACESWCCLTSTCSLSFGTCGSLCRTASLYFLGANAARADSRIVAVALQRIHRKWNENDGKENCNLVEHIGMRVQSGPSVRSVSQVRPGTTRHKS